MTHLDASRLWTLSQALGVGREALIQAAAREGVGGAMTGFLDRRSLTERMVLGEHEIGALARALGVSIRRLKAEGVLFDPGWP